jgi:Rieske Fe-S protein
VEPRHGEEQGHSPSPSIWPVGFAVGIACILAGIVVSFWVAIVGAVIAVVFGALWARDAMATRAHVEPEPPPVAEPAAEDDEELARYPRNKFLELTTLGLGGVIAGIVTLPILGFAVAPAFTGQEHPGVDLGPLDNFPEGEFREVKFLLNPALGEVARRTVFVRYNGTSDAEDEPSFTIMSNRCVHLGCPVQASGPRDDNAQKTVRTGQAPVSLTPVLPAGFSCPCHGGAYSIEGNRVAGPPTHALDRYKFSIIDGNLHLVQLFSVSEVDGEGADAKIKAYPVQGPGEHLDGPEGWLYPIQPQDLEPS